MKFFHTADWHLGKLVQGVYMTDDQRHVLEQLLVAVERERPDAVIIAGDLYDRAVPPTEAVELLGRVLERLTLELQVPVLAISGNHDSPDRLDFATGIMAGRGLYLAGRYRKDPEPVVLRDEQGEVHVHLIPYADPAQVRYILDDETIRSHDDAMKTTLARLEKRLDPRARHVVVAHAFVTPGGRPEENTSDAERPLSIGGTEQVRAEYFSPFHYTALGHLHQAHYTGEERIRYSGSPLKYSISEERHEKGFIIVELDGEGRVQVERRPLTPLRDMRRVEGTIDEIGRHAKSDDYVFVTLQDESPVLFPMEKVRAVYPNAMHVERRAAARLTVDGENGANGEPSVSRRQMDQVALFAAFYREVNGAELGEEKKQLFQGVLEETLREEGEAG